MQLLQKQNPKQLFYFTGFSIAMKLDICIISSSLRSFMIFCVSAMNDDYRTLTLFWRALFCRGLRKGGGTTRGIEKQLVFPSVQQKENSWEHSFFLEWTFHSLGCWNKGIIFFKFTSLNIKGSGNCNEFVWWMGFFSFSLIKVSRLEGWDSRTNRWDSYPVT